MVTARFRFDDGPPRFMLRLQREQRTNSSDGEGVGEESEQLDEAPLSERDMVEGVDAGLGGGRRGSLCAAQVCVCRKLEALVVVMLLCGLSEAPLCW